jgi:hypothetical protein
VHLKKAEDFIKAIIVLFCFCLNSLAWDVLNSWGCGYGRTHCKTSSESVA